MRAWREAVGGGRVRRAAVQRSGPRPQAVALPLKGPRRRCLEWGRRQCCSVSTERSSRTEGLAAWQPPRGVVHEDHPERRFGTLASVLIGYHDSEGVRARLAGSGVLEAEVALALRRWRARGQG